MLIAAGARYVPVHARGKGRLSTMALGPEAWFVWRRTVFPDYLLESVVEPGVWRSAGVGLKKLREQGAAGLAAPGIEVAEPVVAEREPGLTQALHLGRQVVDQEMNAVPAPRLGLSSIRHRARRRALRPAEEQAQAAALHVGECGCLVGQQLKAEVRRVEGDRRLHVVDHVPDMNRLPGHRLDVTEQ